MNAAVIKQHVVHVACKFHFCKLTRKMMKAWMVRVALLVFFLDVLGQFWPAFHVWWESKYHWAVPLAAFLAGAAEWLALSEEQK